MDEKMRAEILEYLSGYRLKHTLGCEKAAVALAKKWGADEEAASLCALLHDITKKLSMEEQLKLCRKYDIIVDNIEKIEPKLLHGKTAAATARARFKISDEIYNAVFCHTTGKPDMTLLDKILYLADYIEENRDFDGVEKIRELAFSDLNEAMLFCFEMSLTDLIARRKLIHKNSVEALNFLYNKI